jgi:uncharacterized repeat protein (TIGR01451 family)
VSEDRVTLPLLEVFAVAFAAATSVLLLAPAAHARARPSSDPGITIIKNAVGLGRSVATFRITVENSGNVTLHGVTVTDPVAPRCSRELDTMAPGTTKTYICTRPDVKADLTNFARAVGLSPTGEQVADMDQAVYVRRATLAFTG